MTGEHRYRSMAVERVNRRPTTVGPNHCLTASSYTIIIENRFVFRTTVLATTLSHCIFFVSRISVNRMPWQTGIRLCNQVSPWRGSSVVVNRETLDSNSNKTIIVGHFHLVCTPGKVTVSTHGSKCVTCRVETNYIQRILLFGVRG